MFAQTQLVDEVPVASCMFTEAALNGRGAHEPWIPRKSLFFGARGGCYQRTQRGVYNAAMTPTPGWQEIPEHTITLRGIGWDTSIVLVADEIIANSVIGFDVSITIADELLLEPIRWRGRGGMYSSLGDFRTQLSHLRSGQPVQARLSLERFELVIYHHRRGVRTGLCVSGTASSSGNPDAWFGPAREQEIGDRLLLDDTIDCCLRFAFTTSLVDPPYIDNFLRDIDALLSCLNEYSGP